MAPVGPYEIRQALEDLNHYATNQRYKLTTKYGALDVLSTQVSQARQAKFAEAMQAIRTVQATQAMQPCRDRRRPLARR